MKPAERPETGDAARRESQRRLGHAASRRPADPACRPLLAAAGVGYGEGFAGNSHRHAPGGMLAAVKYLVEETRRRRQPARSRRQHRHPPRRRARRHGDDPVSRLEGRRREGREPRGADDGGHGERAGAARPAVAGDDQVPREPRREEQPQVPVVLTGAR